MEVGDDVTIHLKNMLTRSVNIHPHGVTFDTDQEIAPGSVGLYKWNPTAMSGPPDGDIVSQTWMYLSNANIPQDFDGTLAGAVIVYRPGTLIKTGLNAPRALDVDREYVVGFFSVRESLSAYAGSNLNIIYDNDALNALADTRYTINGYSFCNLPGL